ncbi:unnamed protein product [Lathyrus oleraceus]
MEILEHRKWMVERMGIDNRRVRDEFLAGVIEFIEFSCAQEDYKKEKKLRCPCKKCKCKKYHIVGDVIGHLCMKGFMDDYFYWTNHGEQGPPFPPIVFDNSYYESSEARHDFNDYEQMVMDVVGPSIGTHLEQQRFLYDEQMIEDPNPTTNFFFF